MRCHFPASVWCSVDKVFYQNISHWLAYLEIRLFCLGKCGTAAIWIPQKSVQFWAILGNCKKSGQLPTDLGNCKKNLGNCSQTYYILEHHKKILNRWNAQKWGFWIFDIPIRGSETAWNLISRYADMAQTPATSGVVVGTVFFLNIIKNGWLGRRIPYRKTWLCHLLVTWPLRVTWPTWW